MTKKALIGIMALMAAIFIGHQLLWAEQAAMPAADGPAFWEYITKTDDYKKWTSWTGSSDLIEGKSPHGPLVRIYGNKAAVEAAQAGKPLPDGSILVKESYDKDKTTLLAVTPMYKKKDFNPAGGDWFWGVYGPAGQVKSAGKLDGCIKCHTAVQGQGWVFSKFKK